MASNEVTVRLTLDTRLFLAWIRLVSVAAYFIAPDRALDWAARGQRLLRVRFDDGPWRWYRP